MRDVRWHTRDCRSKGDQHNTAERKADRVAIGERAQQAAAADVAVESLSEVCAVFRALCLKFRVTAKAAWRLRVVALGRW